MNITVIVPYDDGYADIDGDVSNGLEIYEGHLPLPELEALLASKIGYERVALLVKRKPGGQLHYVEMTGTDREDMEPVDVEIQRQTEPCPDLVGCSGSFFEEGGRGSFSLQAHYSKLTTR